MKSLYIVHALMGTSDKSSQLSLTHCSLKARCWKGFKNVSAMLRTSELTILYIQVVC